MRDTNYPHLQRPTILKYAKLSLPKSHHTWDKAMSLLPGFSYGGGHICLKRRPRRHAGKSTSPGPRHHEWCPWDLPWTPEWSKHRGRTSSEITSVPTEASRLQFLSVELGTGI